VKGIPLSKKVSMMKHYRDLPSEKAKEYPEEFGIESIDVRKLPESPFNLK
jgi:hypothetical protein